MIKKIAILFAFMIWVSSAPAAFAYLDPGTGGMILGSIWPIILSIVAVIVGFFIKYFFTPIKKFFQQGIVFFKRKVVGNLKR
jgi:hypothetical protein